MTPKYQSKLPTGDSHHHRIPGAPRPGELMQHLDLLTRMAVRWFRRYRGAAPPAIPGGLSAQFGT